ncbi:oxidoreductase family protein [Dyadobacter jejuensis]|uniref:Oxidoreductase family protein n=1 Tax=Dyadobacter jejuensis TaxID=1082580 RepID=A0A316AIU7_9BACT|nr:Gfo/Idh/MocA family oxidoreductase [Dyadobacter jejuensis]PWJ56894.1 oxidoreductase family protein [Dyadobacter jejuensis]
MKDPKPTVSKAASRRNFLKNTAVAATSFYILPRHVLGGPGFVAPSDKLNIAGVGVARMGRSNLKALSSENIVALCDVDFAYASPTFEEYPKAKQFKDYRVMLETMHKDIDAVMIATPDHTHATIAMEALRYKKHLYVQKPLTYTVHEARELAKAAKKAKVVTSMGNQGHSSDDARKINEWIWDGAIGDVHTVYAWTNRPSWPQGMPRPTEAMAIPTTLDWDLFSGPAPLRAYHSAYHPWNWRGFSDYGIGALGDMGAHLLDHPNWALDLGAPISVEASCTPWGGTKEDPNVTYPLATQVTYQFAARGKRPPVTLIWCDGGILPAHPDELPAEELMNRGGGVMMVGDKGKLIHGTYGSKPRLLPDTRMAEYKQPTPTIPRIATSHEMDWVRCCKDGKEQPLSNFDYSGPLTEMMLLGVLASRFIGKKLFWNSQEMKFTNAPEANQFVTREYRRGWELGTV